MDHAKPQAADGRNTKQERKAALQGGKSAAYLKNPTLEVGYIYYTITSLRINPPNSKAAACGVAPPTPSSHPLPPFLGPLTPRAVTTGKTRKFVTFSHDK